MYKFDVVVVGGGHAGVEAAHAVSRMGLSCALVTFSYKTIGPKYPNYSLIYNQANQLPIKK